MSVTYQATGDTFIADKPRVRLENAGVWDLAADGRIVTIDRVQSQPADAPAAEHHVVFFEHFLDEVKRKVNSR